MRNGVVMCSIHYKLFDKGAFTVLSRRFVLSESVYGNSGFEDMFYATRVRL